MIFMDAMGTSEEISIGAMIFKSTEDDTEWVTH